MKSNDIEERIRELQSILEIDEGFFYDYIKKFGDLPELSELGVFETTYPEVVNAIRAFLNVKGKMFN